MKKISSFTCAVAATLLTAAGLVSSPVVYAGQFIVTGVHVDQSRQAQTCLQNSLCSTALSALTTSLGVPSEAVSLASAAARIVPMSAEEHSYYIPAPSGYKLCGAYVAVNSVIPASGSRAPHLEANTFYQNQPEANQNLVSLGDGLSLYLVTPRQGIGQGQSSIELDAFVVGVKAEVAEMYYRNGTCKRPNSGDHFVNFTGQPAGGGNFAYGNFQLMGGQF